MGVHFFQHSPHSPVTSQRPGISNKNSPTEKPNSPSTKNLPNNHPTSRKKNTNHYCNFFCSSNPPKSIPGFFTCLYWGLLIMRTTFGFNAFQSTGKAVSDFLAYTETWISASGLGVWNHPFRTAPVLVQSTKKWKKPLGPTKWGEIPKTFFWTSSCAIYSKSSWDFDSCFQLSVWI